MVGALRPPYCFSGAAKAIGKSCPPGQDRSLRSLDLSFECAYRSKAGTHGYGGSRPSSGWAIAESVCIQITVASGQPFA